MAWPASEELRSICIEADVKLVACQMTVELFGHSHDEFIPEIKDWIGAASFLPVAQKSDVLPVYLIRPSSACRCSA